MAGRSGAPSVRICRAGWRHCDGYQPIRATAGGAAGSKTGLGGWWAGAWAGVEPAQPHASCGLHLGGPVCLAALAGVRESVCSSY